MDGNRVYQALELNSITSVGASQAVYYMWTKIQPHASIVAAAAPVASPLVV
jgi:hypothetical protein